MHYILAVHQTRVYGDAQPLSLEIFCSIATPKSLLHLMLRMKMLLTDMFSVPPGEHAEDVPYSFYSEGDNPSDTLVTSLAVANVLPNIITSLAVSGIPQFTPNDTMEKYGSKEVILNIASNATSERIGDPWRSKRCSYWQNGMFVQR